MKRKKRKEHHSFLVVILKEEEINLFLLSLEYVECFKYETNEFIQLKSFCCTHTLRENKIKKFIVFIEPLVFVDHH